MKREEVDRRVKEDAELYSNKFSEDAKACCMAVSTTVVMRSAQTSKQTARLDIPCLTMRLQIRLLFFSVVNERPQVACRVPASRSQRCQVSGPI